MNVTSTYISHVPNYPELKHPIHWEHLLFSTKPHHNGKTCTCNGCESPCKWFVYHCALCKFDLDIKCVSLPLTIKTEIHEHPLNLFGKKILMTCDFCGKEGNNMPYLCGSSCGFWVHHKCASLPRIVKHIRHKHPLNLTCSLIKDGHSNNLFCQLCTTLVDTNYGVYYCSSCDYVAHLDCATDKKGSDEIFVREPKEKHPIEPTPAILKEEDSRLDKSTNKPSYVVKKTKVREGNIEIAIDIKLFSNDL
uniref:DC1 domain-containing protein n=1 Tax=Fagus sylvatica TaxID=28930 RepID=A0A2N9ER94_FAGSY